MIKKEVAEAKEFMSAGDFGRREGATNCFHIFYC
jgi:hypothetical protein